MNRSILLLGVMVFFFLTGVFAQDGITYDLKKPAKFENRLLASEKTPDKKFKLPRHFIQNTITHYNYYFNANNKLNEVIARAKMSHRDDYTKTLSFFNYSLDATSADKRELDSVILKATTGILIHDLRTDWVDNMYMLMGKAYYFEKEYDTAYTIFQFVNYAFSPKEKGGYDIPIGSNINIAETGTTTGLTVSTDESNRNLPKRIFSMPPSRNDALVWQIFTYLSRDMYTEAATLLETLKHDPRFPERLHEQLEELEALWYYRQNRADSAAAHLQKAIGIAGNKQEQARREFLVGQLYEKSGSPDEAKDFYERSIRDTYDPLLELYARLNAIRQNKGNQEDYIQKNIDALVKMGKRDKYETYRDIIYYTAAQIELERKNRAGAVAFLNKSIKYTEKGTSQWNRSYLLLGQLSLIDKKYKEARAAYDSVDVQDQSVVLDAEQFSSQRKALDVIMKQQYIIDEQDSLQRIAAMPEAERAEFIKKLSKLLRKKQGLKEEEFNSQGNYFGNANNPNQTDLFANPSNNNFNSRINNNTATEAWYFDNNALKSRGFTDFKTKWGNRPNQDNWFLSSKGGQVGGLSTDRNGNVITQTAEDAPPVNTDFSIAGLTKNLPLTPAALKLSNDSIDNALFLQAKTFQEGIPDYDTAVRVYEKLLDRFRETKHREEAIFNIYYCYLKLGRQAEADKALKLLKEKYADGSFNQRLNKDAKAREPIPEEQRNATDQYTKIYNSFIEGDFENALSNKKKADSLYGDKYWSPQLLYIQGVYYISKKDDSSAKVVLNTIVAKYNGTPMAEKAKTFLDVLSRRKQIETYLTNLQITRAPEDSVVYTPPANQPLPAPPVKLVQGPIVQQNKPKNDSAVTVIAKPKADSTQFIKKPETLARSGFSFSPDKPHDVVIVLDKVDPVYVTETRNAFNRYNRESWYNKQFEINNVPISDSIKFVVISGFENAGAAIDYYDKAKKAAPRDIVPWLPAGKYSFLIISPENLEVLKLNKDLTGYKKFLGANIPGKF